MYISSNTMSLHDIRRRVVLVLLITVNES